jgi:hypothetical protein
MQLFSPSENTNPDDKSGKRASHQKSNPARVWDQSSRALSDGALIELVDMVRMLAAGPALLPPIAVRLKPNLA